MFRGYNAQLRKLEVCHTVYMYVAQTLLHVNELAWVSLGWIVKNDLFRLNQSQKRRFNKNMVCNIQSNNQKSKDSINGKSTRSKKDENLCAGDRLCSKSNIGLMKYEKEKWILSSRVSPPQICPPVESGSMCATDSSSRGEWLDIKAGDWQLAGVGVGVRGEWLDIKAGDWQLAGVFNEARSLRLRPFVPAVHCQIYLKGAFWVGCILWQAGQRRGGFELGYIRGNSAERSQHS